ncbi:MAG: glycogen-binding domain-containing protein [Phycisphaerae bacterium]|jgi:1,4-alpha-glucan branching enzyme
MFAKGAKSKQVRFELSSASSAREVKLAGDFNAWKPVPMRKSTNGSYTLQVEVPQGICQYKFVIDGQWTTDPDHNNLVRNSFGTFNSVARL